MFCVHFKKPPQVRTRLRPAETVCPESKQLARQVGRHLLRYGPHVVARRNRRDGRVRAEYLLDIGRLSWAVRVQPVQPLRGDRVAAQFLVAGGTKYSARHVVPGSENLLCSQYLAEDRPAAEKLHD